MVWSPEFAHQKEYFSLVNYLRSVFPSGCSRTRTEAVFRKSGRKTEKNGEGSISPASGRRWVLAKTTGQPFSLIRCVFLFRLLRTNSVSPVAEEKKANCLLVQKKRLLGIFFHSKKVYVFCCCVKQKRWTVLFFSCYSKTRMHRNADCPRLRNVGKMETFFRVSQLRYNRLERLFAGHKKRKIAIAEERRI